jgi:putative transposase
VLIDKAGEVEVAVPRDRDGMFTPVIVDKRHRRLSDVGAVLSLYARGLTAGEMSAHFAEVYGASVSKDTVSRITDRVVEDMHGWASRPLQPLYEAIFIDAIRVKVRDGQVDNQLFYAAIGVDLAGRHDVLGLWAGASPGLARARGANSFRGAGRRWLQLLRGPWFGHGAGAVRRSRRGQRNGGSR